MPHENKNFGGSFVLDFRKWWRHVKTIYYMTSSVSRQDESNPALWLATLCVTQENFAEAI